MSKMNEFQKKDQLPLPTVSLNDILSEESFDLIEVEESVYDSPYQIWSLEMNTNQDQITIKIKPSDEIDGPTEYRVKVELDRMKSGRFSKGQYLYSLNEIQVVRFILEMFDKHGQCGHQYNEFWEI